MQVNFLGKDNVHLAKTFDVAADGSLDEHPYPLVKNFNSYHENDVQDIHDLLYVLEQHASAGNCFLNGTLIHPLQNESRAGKIDPLALHPLLVLDIDGMNEPGILPTFDPITRALGLDQTSHIIQYSASMGVKQNKGPSAHLFFILDEPLPVHEIKNWTLHHNLSTPLFVRHLSLTRAFNALKYTLDPTSNENNRIIYIAPPIIRGMDDPYPNRFQLIERDNPTLKLDTSGLLGEKQLNQLKKDQVNRLRTEQRLPPITVSTRKRQVGDEQIDVAVNASPVAMTGHKEERGFVYFNFNGGDSWAYFHPIEAPDIVYNFKGEDALLTREVLPEYHVRAKARAREYIEELRQREEQELAEAAQRQIEVTIGELNAGVDPNRPPIPFVFTNGDSGQYQGGIHRPADGSMEIYQLRSIVQVEAFCTQHGMELPGVIPTWKTTYDPRTLQRFMLQENRLNMYSPSQYKVNAVPELTPPTVIMALIEWVMGGNKAFTEHFINWLAFIWQTGRKPETAFVLTGTVGTGKGTLQQRVITPLLGEHNVMPRTLDSFEKEYNHDMVHSQIVWVEEPSTDATSTPKKVAQHLLTLITDEGTPHRKMHTDYKRSPSFFGMIFSSNVVNVTIVQLNDRRFNIAPRQEESLRNAPFYTLDLHDRIKAELQTFANYLTAYKVNDVAVRTPLWSDAKDNMITSTTEVPADIAHALKTGDFEYFYDQLPTDPSTLTDPATISNSPSLLNYIEVLDRIVDQYRQGQTLIPLLRDDVQIIFRYCAGWTNQTPTKFTKAVSKYGLPIKQVYLGTDENNDDRTGRGIKVEFTISPVIMRRYLQLYSRLKKIKVVSNSTPTAHTGASHGA
jgi:hypothetical protein